LLPELNRYSEDELKEISAQHNLWPGPAGDKGKCADLRGASLISAIGYETIFNNVDLASDLLEYGSANHWPSTSLFAKVLIEMFEEAWI